MNESSLIQRFLKTFLVFSSIHFLCIFFNKVSSNLSIKTENGNELHLNCLCVCFMHFHATEKDKRQQIPEEDALDHICHYKDKPFLEKRRIPAIKSKCLSFNFNEGKKIVFFLSG